MVHAYVDRDPYKCKRLYFFLLVQHKPIMQIIFWLNFVYNSTAFESMKIKDSFTERVL